MTQNAFMKQGEIWLINLDPTIGSELKKTRPAVVINDNALGKLPLKVIVPVTDWKPNYSLAIWMVKLEPDHQNGLTKLSSADCFQIRSVSESRFIRKIGQVTNLELNDIKRAVAAVISL